MIPRDRHLRALEAQLRRYPVVGLIGARQAGKTTLARAVARGSSRPTTIFDLEDPTDGARLSDPMLALRQLRGLVIIDEIQHRPDLFQTLRVLADRARRPARFLILGSASPDLLRQSAESLAGRIHYHELPPLNLQEVGAQHLHRLWLRGGFPLSFQARSERQSVEWRQDLISTFLQRDIPQHGIRIPAETLRRFWTMLAHGHGELLNTSELGRSFGVADTTVRRYLDILISIFVVKQLRPWRENIAKRQVRSPKVYLSDSGILHALLGLPTRRDLEGHPKLGASWEGFALSQVVQCLGARPDECHFWATHQGAELDLLVVRGRRRLGFEFKHTSAPRVTRSMRQALRDLDLASLHVIHPGDDSFPMAERVTAVGMTALGDTIKPLP